VFQLLLFNLRAQGVRVGMGEWLAFLDGLGQGLVNDLHGLYGYGRAVLIHSETAYDAWDLAFRATFEGVELPPALSEALQAWLRDARPAPEGDLAPVDLSPEELRALFLRRLQEQTERHDGGNRWIGTGGTSPFGHGGKAERGIRVGGGGGNRSAVQVAGERQWADYRVDRRLDQRDFQVALRALRSLAPEGPETIDLDGSIDATAQNGGDIDLVFSRERKNRVHLVLLLDTGGSMEPHARLVSSLFAAASEAKGFKSLQTWQFHNAPYGWLYKSYARYERAPIPEVLRAWTPDHRLVFVGDASMAPYELFTPFKSGPWLSDKGGHAGLDWLQMIRQRCPASVWLNPDPERFWDHPTVRAIGGTFPMFPLTLQGLRDAVRRLRRGR
jgi:uncharacterized protein